MKQNYSLFIVVAILLLFCFSILYFLIALPFRDAAIDSSVSVLLFAALSIGLRYSSRFIPFNKEFFGRFLVSHSVGSILFTAIWMLPTIAALRFLVKEENYSLFLMQSIPWRFVIGMMFYFLVQSFIYLIMFYDNYAKAAKDEAELKNLITESELRSLKYQLNPHFLFNSLNSISALAEANPKLARSMTIKLSEYMRSTLSTNEKSFHSFNEEIKNILLYVEIEKIRFADKFTFTTVISDDSLNRVVPNMILQPLIENAIKYGTLDSIDPVNILLEAKIADELLRIKVENDFAEEKSAHKESGTGTGLENVNRRLKLSYKRNDLFEAINGENKFIVEIKIPERTI